MRDDWETRLARWASWAIIAGGLLMAVLWMVFTTAHGPTSYSEDRVVLGRTMHFWGSLLGVTPNLLLSLGLILLYTRLAHSAGRLARWGYAFTLIGLLVPAAIDLTIGALGPPFFSPLLAAGLMMLALGSVRNPRAPDESYYPLMLLGILQIIAFGWVLVPLDLTDQVGGYRLYGIVAQLLSGAAWIALGISYRKVPTSVRS
jgi:hypothetical protein